VSSAASPCANGRCPTGYQRPAGQKANPYKGLSADQIPTKVIEIALTEKIPAGVFNAFQQAPPAVESKPKPNAWGAFPEPSHGLRSYLDCFEHEKEFVLVVGPESTALMTLEATDKPVAHEVKFKALKPGSYRFYHANERLMYVPFGQPPAITSATIRIRKQQ
jgi:hypothetical protein